MLLNNPWITKKLKKEIKKYLEINENESTTVKNLSDAAKEALNGKFIMIQFYLKKQEKISNKQPHFTPTDNNLV